MGGWAEVDKEEDMRGASPRSVPDSREFKDLYLTLFDLRADLSQWALRKKKSRFNIKKNLIIIFLCCKAVTCSLSSD